MKLSEAPPDLYILFALNLKGEKTDALMIWETVPSPIKITQALRYFTDFQGLRWINYRILHLTINLDKTAYRIVAVTEC